MSTFGPDDLIACYRRGVFPMADARDDPRVFLMDPELRGIIPLDQLHISRSLSKFMRKMNLTISFDRAFATVISKCAEEAPDRKNTWINAGIEYLYTRLHDQGNAHSVEVWEEGKLVGGLYGVSIGGAFFGESMFSRRTNASKVALVKLVERLNSANYTLLDTQFLTDHLQTMGAIEVPRDEYLTLLKKALAIETRFNLAPKHKS